MTPEYDELIDTFICFRLYTYIILNIYVYIQFNVSKMDGYRLIELGQELRCVKEMGATLWCLSMHFTLHPPPSPWQLARLLPMTALVCSIQLAVDFQMRSATLASGNGKMEKLAGIIEDILYPTLSNSVQAACILYTYSDLHIWIVQDFYIKRNVQGKWT